MSATKLLTFMKDQYSQGNTLNEQQEEWKVANNSSIINRNSTKRCPPIAFRNKFQPIYIEPIDLKEEDPHDKKFCNRIREDHPL